MRQVLGVVLAILLLSALGCGGVGGLGGGGGGCLLDRNGDGALSDADFADMSPADATALQNEILANPLSVLPCLPMIEAAGEDLDILAPSDS